MRKLVVCLIFVTYPVYADYESDDIASHDAQMQSAQQYHDYVEQQDMQNLMQAQLNAQASQIQAQQRQMDTGQYSPSTLNGYVGQQR